MSHSWHVTLDGDPADLDMLVDSFGGSAISITKEDATTYALRLPEFATLNDPLKIRDRAIEIVTVLNGAVRLGLDSGKGIRVGSVHEATPEGNRTIHVSPDFGTVHARAFVSAVVIRADGTEVISRPGDPVRDWMEVGLTDAEAAKVLKILGRGVLDWVNLYRLFEIIEADAGGIDQIERQGWATKAIIRLFKHTSNHPAAAGMEARHGVMPTEPPRKPMSLPEAKTLILGLTQAWLRSKAEVPDAKPSGAVPVTGSDMPEESAPCPDRS
jgi:hypothetical protein